MTEAYLSTLDILVLGSAVSCCGAIAPLTASEQAAVFDFIGNGGRFLFLSDNLLFAATADVANASILATVGITPGGQTFLGDVPIMPTGDPSHPILDGRSGSWSSSSTNYPGIFGNTGGATVLGHLNGNPAWPALAAFEVGDLSPLSGRGVAVSDVNGVDLVSNQVMTNNIIDYLISTVEELEAVPEPSRAVLSMLALGTVLFRRRRA